MKRTTWRTAILATLVVALSGGCAADDEGIVAIDGEPYGGALFARYVALGNSITAGFQSLGINDSTQRQTYPYLVARQANANFTLPLLPSPGCPPPLIAPFATSTIAGTPLGETVCLLRASPAPRILQNLAVPGANILDAVDHLANTDPGDTFNRLQTFILGGRSQVSAMVAADPSLISVALGSGDALGAALNGDTEDLTPVASFSASLDELTAAILSTRAQDVVLLSVIDTNAMPALQPGLFYWAISQNPATAPLLPKPVSDDCAPLTGPGQPNPLTRNIIAYTALLDAGVEELSCANDAPFVLTAAEQGVISARVAAYNALLSATAEENGWLYLDLNTILLPALGDPALLRKCQGLATATTPQEIMLAVLATCPNPDPAIGFGAYISFDGIHPSLAAHREIARAMIVLLNARHGLQIPEP